MTIMPGYALIEMDEYFPETGDIIAPEITTARRSNTGIIRVITPSARDLRCYGKSLPRVDDRVLVDHSQGYQHDGNIYIYRLTVMVPVQGKRKRSAEPVLIAVIEGEFTAKPVEQEIERCRFCGPAVRGGTGQAMILQPGEKGEMVCPRCHCNRYGRVPDDAVTVSDDELGEFQEGLRRRELAAAGRR